MPIDVLAKRAWLTSACVALTACGGRHSTPNLDAGVVITVPPEETCPTTERTVNLGVHFDFEHPGPIDQTQVLVTGNCTVRTHLIGTRVAEPLAVPGAISFPDTRWAASTRRPSSSAT